MFWKFVVGALVLPGCLGLEIAAASLGKDNVEILPKSEKLELSLAKTQDYKVDHSLTPTTRESSTIPANQEANTEQLKEGADIPLKISHRYRRYYRRPCYRRRRYRRNYYRRRRYYHPAYYRRRRYRRHRYHRHYHRHYYRRGHRRYYYRHRHYHRH